MPIVKLFFSFLTASFTPALISSLDNRREESIRSMNHKMVAKKLIFDIIIFPALLK